LHTAYIVRKFIMQTLVATHKLIEHSILMRL
jgi:hypothetical protein